MEAGEFDFTPILTVEGHAGFDDNLEIPEKHYAADFLIGGEFAWGLGNDKQFFLSAFVGPAFVRGGAEHFYGEIHLEDHHDEDHHDEDHHDEEEHDEDHHDEEEHEAHEHEAHPTRSRVDFKAYLEANYKHSDRLNVQAYWSPYLVTSNELEFHADENEWEEFESKGIKNELGAKVKYAFGDGDVDFGLGDTLADLIDGTYVSVDHRQGWGVDEVYIGNYTDPRLGLGFKYDKLNVRLDGGPRLYVPGSYSGLDQRTDFAAELSLSYELSEKTELFAQWQQTYSWEDAPGWGEGWQHHVGTGVTFAF